MIIVASLVFLFVGYANASTTWHSQEFGGKLVVTSSDRNDDDSSPNPIADVLYTIAAFIFISVLLLLSVYITTIEEIKREKPIEI